MANMASGDAESSEVVIEQLPEEFRGVPPAMIERNIKRLELDMEAEIATIKQRYRDKIEHLEGVLKIAQRQEQTSS